MREQIAHVIFITSLIMISTINLQGCQQATLRSDDHVDRLINNSGMMRNAMPLYQPDLDLPELFARVQNEAIFNDTKTFVDSTPKQAPSAILAQYQLEKNSPTFKLKDFVAQHFTPPPPLPVTQVDKSADMLTHLKAHWPVLVRTSSESNAGDYSTILPLPHPYVVPGGRFREMFYWDSYFSMLGLMQSDQDALVLGMIDNFAHLIAHYSYIPNGNRSYFLNRSQPPFFAAMLQLYAKKHGTAAVIGYLPALEQEYAFWMDGHTLTTPPSGVGNHLIVTETGELLNRYYGSRDEPRAEAFTKENRWAESIAAHDRPLFFKNLRAACESGWDFSSRWFADGQSKSTIHTMEIIPVDLSSLIYSMETTLAELYQLKGDSRLAAHYQARASARKATIQKYHFDAGTGSYQDYDFVAHQATGRLSIAMAFPLFFHAATDDAAKQVARVIQSQFLQTGGVLTTLVNSGEQWDAPNGWAPMQFVAVQGLINYDEKPLALEIAQRWIALNQRVYDQEGKMMEKYNVVDPTVKAGGGNYPNQDGFGWTNGVDIVLIELLRQQK